MQPEETLVNLKFIVNSLIFSIIGIIVLAIAFWVFDLLTPGRLWDHIAKEKNVALAITAGAMILGLSIIIAASIHG